MKRKIIIILTCMGLIIMFVVTNPGQILTKTILRLMGHYKTPKAESPESIIDFTTKQGAYYDHLYVVNGIDGVQELQKNGVSGVPTIQIFDKNRRLMTMAAQTSCDWNFVNFFKDSSDQLIPGDSTTFTKVVENLYPVDIKAKDDTFQYYLISYWAKYFPKLTDRLFEQTNTMKREMKEKVCFMTVSLDEQEGWADQKMK